MDMLWLVATLAGVLVAGAIAVPDYLSMGIGFETAVVAVGLLCVLWTVAASRRGRRRVQRVAG